MIFSKVFCGGLCCLFFCPFCLKVSERTDGSVGHRRLEENCEKGRVKLNDDWSTKIGRGISNYIETIFKDLRIYCCTIRSPQVHPDNCALYYHDLEFFNRICQLVYSWLRREKVNTKIYQFVIHLFPVSKLLRVFGSRYLWRQSAKMRDKEMRKLCEDKSVWLYVKDSCFHEKVALICH